MAATWSFNGLVVTIERPRINGGAARLGETGRARIELRSNRRTGEITLFVNDEFTAQWNGLDMAADEAADGDAAGKGKASGGSGFGFVAQGGDSPVRISDIIISEWNGMPDSARSLQMDEQDVVLMTNGTDRYSGKVGSLDDVTALNAEKKRIADQAPLPAADPASLPASLGKLRATYRKASAPLIKQRDAAADPVYARYDAALAAFETELSQASATADANRALEERVHERTTELNLTLAGRP